MNIRTLTLYLVTLVYFNVSAAEKMTVYRWSDEHNVVHFSQHQPNRDDYIEISMSNNSKPSEIIDKATKTKSSGLKNIALSDGSKENDVNNNLSNEKCLTAQKNIKTLDNFDQIQYKDENGNVKVLTALQKQRQLVMNTKQADVYCTN